MNYQQCLRYLEKIQNLGIKFGLDNVRILLDSLGNPHRKYHSLLVAGTNGKGSVCAMLAQILSLHDLRVGVYTSPHLNRVEERIRIGGKIIPRQSFCRLLTVIKEEIEVLIASKRLLSPPTYFELLTCLALFYFREKKVDMAVLEVGMGGRFDATNVVEPSLTVITTISFEHQKFLGESLSQIASEKAGIIRSRIPVVCGVEEDEAYEAIRKRAQELSAPFFGVFEREGCFLAHKREKNYCFTYQSDEKKYIFLPSLPGEHQGKNASVAVAAAEQLSRNWRRLEKEKIIQGIENTRWAGRLEIIQHNPPVILDGAHNEEGARALSKYIKDFLSPPLILVFAIMRDKEIRKLADILFPLARKVILTEFPYFRAASPEEVKAKALKFEDRLILEPDTNKAFDLALQSAGQRSSILITGSLYLVGEIKKRKHLFFRGAQL